MWYISGDTHAEFNRFSTKRFPAQKEMTRDDYVIICGDFAGVWDYKLSSPEESYWLDWLNNKPFTTLFVDGNHSNHTRLKEFPRVKFHGGMAHKIRDNVYHLMRGYVFEIDGKKIFTFGGAKSHDIQDGILYQKDYASLRDLVDDYNRRTKMGEMLRIDEISWWKDELPTSAEMKRGIKNLEKVNWTVDYVITHCPPREVCKWFGYYDSDKLIEYFDELLERGLKFKEWWGGHLHKNEYGIYGKYNVIYEDIVRLL